MRLPDSLIKKFVRITNDRKPEPKEETIYGTVVTDGSGNVQGVQFDGSEIVTPCTPAVAVSNGDRVIVMVKNREAVITSNVTNPSLNVRSLGKNNVVTNDELKSRDPVEINGGVIDCDYLKVARKIIVYAPVWDPDEQKYIGETDTFEVVSMAEVNPYYSELWAFQNIDKVMFATPYEDSKGDIHYPEVQMYNLGVNTLRVADREGSQHGMGIYYGTIDGFSVPANGYIDVDIDFPEGAFSKTHRVALTPQSAQTHADTGEISWGITSRTLDSVTVRVFNNSSNARFMAFDWIAIGE